MVKVTIEQLRSLMDNPENIRNFSVVAHVDHGKSTLTDSLLFSNGIISKEDVGNKRGTDTRPDEALRGITIKSTGVSLFYEMAEALPLPKNSVGRQFLMNLIDSPGHVDFSSEVTAALRLTDGALVLVDCVEGCCVQTETVLRQALAERVKPVLTINKLDRAFTELQLDPESMYKSFSSSIQSVNNIISTFQADSWATDLEVYPEKGTVCFSAGKQGWAFTLRQFARMYKKKFPTVSEDKLTERLWGDNYFDPDAKKWIESPISSTGKTLLNGFCEFIIKPIASIFKACLSKDVDTVDKLLKNSGVVLTKEEKEAEGKEVLKSFMQRWLPASDALLEMIVTHLPSPVVAQKYRVEGLYTGPLDDITAEAIRKCDPNGPLVMFISKMIPTKDNSRFFAFGRVFSGTVTSQKVRILGANWVPGKKEDMTEDVAVQRIVIMMTDRTPAIESVPCGNTCALVGIDSYLNKSGTILSDPTSFPLINMKYSVAPVVRVAVRPKNPATLPKLVEGLKRLSKSDPLVQIAVESTGEYIISASGELHLEIVLSDLKDFCHQVELVVSQPVVPFQETVTAQSSVQCLAKSTNHLNRLIAEASPLGKDVVAALESGLLNNIKDPKTLGKKFETDFNWDPTAARKVWAFGPEAQPANVLVDLTKGIQYMNEVKDSIVSGFQFVSNTGVLAEEKLQGVRFNILDAVLHSDNVHRGGAQMMPTARRVFYASQYTAKPKLLEPVYLAEIQCSEKSLGGVYNALNQKRATVIEASQKIGTPIFVVKAYFPVAESFGFVGFLRSQTSGQAFPSMSFDHWEIIDENPFEEGTRAAEIVKDIRKRKGLNLQIPSLDHYMDKL